ncbi:MAG: ATP-dependent sacrificial sulfur transferase LarE [Collinsella intestinalis]
MTIPISNNAKMQGLIELLRSFGSVAIGFSGGVDSTFLAAVSIRALPPADVHLIHLDTPFVGTPERESFERERERFERAGAHVVAIETDPLADPDVAANPADRCYHCKRLGFRRIVDAACELGVRVVLEGSNADDAGDYRPGTRAVRELDVRSPLMETGWCKDEEREVLHAWGFDVWDLPAGACLATRIPCGEVLTAEKLHTVRMCEDYLHGLGLRQVRVRIDGGMARVSVGNDELESLLFDTAAEDAPSLPLDVVRELERQGDLKVDPIVRAYIHGEGNGRN